MFTAASSFSIVAKNLSITFYGSLSFFDFPVVFSLTNSLSSIKTFKTKMDYKIIPIMLKYKLNNHITGKYIIYFVTLQEAGRLKKVDAKQG